MLNISCRHSFRDFVKKPHKFLLSLVRNNYEINAFSPSEGQDNNTVEKASNK